MIMSTTAKKVLAICVTASFSIFSTYGENSIRVSDTVADSEHSADLEHSECFNSNELMNSPADVPEEDSSDHSEESQTPTQQNPELQSNSPQNGTSNARVSQGRGPSSGGSSQGGGASVNVANGASQGRASTVKDQQPRDASAFNAVGIQNMGASCYLNACIQQLYRSPIKRHLLSIPDANRSTQPVAYAMQNIFRAMDAQGSGSINIASYRDALGRNIYDGTQMDSSEIFDEIIDRLERELSQIKPMLNIGLTTTIRYNGLRPTSTSRVVETSLILPLYPSLDGAITGYTADNPFQDNYGGGFRKTSITSTSDMLKISIDRFTYRDRAAIKLNARMTFPQFLSIQSAGKSYEITGITVHEGNANNGHYISYIKSPYNDNWYEINDATVRKMPNFESVTRICYGGGSSDANAYVLFYSQRH